MIKLNNVSSESLLNTSLSFLALAFPTLWFLLGNTDWVIYSLLVGCTLSWLSNPAKNKNINALAILAILFALIIHGEYLWHKYDSSLTLFSGKSSQKYLYFFFTFGLIAYATSLKKINPFWVLISAALGVTLHIIFKIPYADWMTSWQGGRPCLGFRNAQHAGVIFATTLLCIAFFAKRLYFACSEKYKLLVSTWLTCLTAVVLWFTITTQDRAVWLGLAIACSITLPSQWPNLRNKLSNTWLKNYKKWWLILAAIIIIFAMMSSMGIFNRINSRLSAEAINYKTIEQASQFKEGSLNSSGIRIASWSAALGWGLERPLLGWGFRSIKGLIQHDKRFSDPLWKNFGHLHNSYLEAWVAVGLIGLSSMLATIIIVGRHSIQSWKQRCMPNEVYLFSWTFITFWLVVNCFESYINYSPGFYLTTVIGAFIYAYHLQCNPQKIT